MQSSEHNKKNNHTLKAKTITETIFLEYKYTLNEKIIVIKKKEDEKIG